MPSAFRTQWLGDVRVQFEKLKRLSEGALAQAHDHELNLPIDPESNSLAVIVKHMAGNLRSRFTDFMTTDGEKPDRNRDDEFEIDSPVNRQAMLEEWERGWQTLFSALEALAPSDLEREVTIRGERHTVVQALNRQIAHHAYHTGQLVFLVKHFRAEEWKTLSIPRKAREGPASGEPREPR